MSILPTFTAYASKHGNWRGGVLEKKKPKGEISPEAPNTGHYQYRKNSDQSRESAVFAPALE